jgi:transcriptional regulator with XRE-family HTH domain
MMLQRVQALSPETIRAARRAVGMSQRELAGRLGYTASWLSNIEHGKRGLSWREAPHLVEVLLAEYAARKE